MNRLILFATIAVCAFGLTVNAVSGAAETKTSASSATRAIAVEVLIVGAKGPAKGDQAVGLSGPSDEVAARVRELESEGQIAVIDRIRLTTLEGQKALFQSGINAPIVTGSSVRARGGPAQRSYEYQNVGTLISATARGDGDAVLVELTVEKSQLGQRASKPLPEDEFVPLGTETLTLQATMRIGSGRMVLAGGLERRADAEASAQLVLVSARLLEPSSNAKHGAMPEGTAERHIKIFSLQLASAKDAAAVIKGLLADDSAQVRVGIDSRTNSLIVSAEEEQQLEVVEAILLRLDQGEPWQAPQAQKGEEKSTPSPPVTKYDKMEKNDLREELRKLQTEVLDAERVLKEANDEAGSAAKAYKSARDAAKADALFCMIEADAARRKPRDRYMKVRSDFEAAKRAYVNLPCSD